MLSKFHFLVQYVLVSQPENAKGKSRKAFQRLIKNPGASFRVSNMCNLCQSVILPLRKQPSQMKQSMSIFILSDGAGRALWIMEMFKSK